MIFAKLKTKLKTLFTELDSYLETHIDTALQITSKLKTLITSPQADVIAALLPAGLDPNLQQQLVNVIDKAIAALSLAENCKQYSATDEKLQCFLTQLQQLTPQLQQAVLQKLASVLTGLLHGQSLKQHLYDVYTQVKYSVEQAVV